MERLKNAARWLRLVPLILVVMTAVLGVCLVVLAPLIKDSQTTGLFFGLLRFIAQ